MYNFQITKTEKEKILNNIFFTERQKIIFELLTQGIQRKDIIKYVKCCQRTINYEIRKISKKIDSLENKEYGITYKVYAHKFPNGKIYIGVCENISQRWQRYGGGYRNNPKMYADILKYGWNNIEHKILLITSDSFQARELETKLITLFELTNDKKGYNKTT